MLFEQLTDFFHSALVSSTFEWSIQKLIDNLQSRFLRDETSRKRDDVAIIMLAPEVSNLNIPA
jgi:predicted ATPase with chaperone activity